MRPSTAVAAATAGLARKASDWGEPIRPIKLRLLVDKHRSPGPKTPK